MCLRASGQGLTSGTPPTSCDLSFCFLHSPGLDVHWLRPLCTSSLRSTAWGCCCVSCGVTHGVCPCAHTPISAGPRSPPRWSQKQCVDGRGWASVPAARGSGAIPKPLCFPSPPLCRPSSLFLFLFCCRFNFSSWTLSVLLERYLVSPLPVWRPPLLSFFSTPCIPSPCPKAGRGRTLSCSSEQRLVSLHHSLPSEAWLPSAPRIVTSAQ